MKFRPHHFLCTLGFEGKGYSEQFVSNYSTLVSTLQEDTLIEVTRSADTICAPCPNRVGVGCTSAAKIEQLDSAHQKILGLSDGEKLSWSEAQARIREHMTLEKFHEACTPCSWKPLGVCERALKRLKGLIPGVLLSSFVVSLLASALALPVAAATPTPSAQSASLRALVKATEKNQYKDLEALSPSQQFFDHAQAILARRDTQGALVSLSKNRVSDATRLAKKAIDHWAKVQQVSAGSPWLKKVADEIGRAELVLARAAYSKKKKDPARAYFESAFERMPLSWVSWQDVDSYLDTCGSWEKRESVDVCMLWVRRLLGVFPKASPERKSLESRWLAVIDMLERMPLAPGGGRVHQAYKSPDPDQQAWEELLPKIRERNLRWAASDFEEFLEKFPRSQLRQKVRYWWAISLLESGPDKKALSLLEQVARESPLSFYGLLSARQLNQDPSLFLSPEAPSQSPRTPNLHPAEWRALERAEVLLKAGLSELAAMELREIRIREGLDSEFLVYLAQLYQEAGAHLGAFSVITELIQRGSKAATTQWASEIVFPIEHWSRIESAAKAKNIDPIWALSLIKQESAFDEAALSSSGAVGLMQVMPTTALDMDPAVLRVELGEHDRNVTIGTAYLAFLSKRFKGNLALSTAGYNAGPQAVERWIKEYGSSLGLIEFIESIPYRETRDYVGSIIRNYFWYSKKLKTEPVLMPSPTPSELDYFWKPTPQNGSA